MWDAQRTRQWDLYLRSGAVVIAAFVVTGLIFVALQKAMGTANQRLTNRFNRASETEATRRAQTPAYSPGSPFAANAPNSATGMPSAYAANATPGLPPTQPLSGVTIPSVPASVNTAFPVEADRRNAQLAVRPFKDALTSVRQYDTSALWSDIPTASGTTPGTVVNALIPPASKRFKKSSIKRTPSPLNFPLSRTRNGIRKCCATLSANRRKKRESISAPYSMPLSTRKNAPDCEHLPTNICHAVRHYSRRSSK
jgi:hypothetical protein